MSHSPGPWFWSARTLRREVHEDEDRPTWSEDILSVDRDRCIYGSQADQDLIAAAPDLLEALKAVGDLLATATFNRFGKPEWLSEEGRDARERVRLLALNYGVAVADTIIEQAGNVARAAIAKAEGK